jgi:hypothetical protein
MCAYSAKYLIHDFIRGIPPHWIVPVRLGIASWLLVQLLSLAFSGFSG